jgi:hypothetical protein
VATKTDLHLMQFPVPCLCVKRLILHTQKHLLDYHEDGGIKFHRNIAKTRQMSFQTTLILVLAAKRAYTGRHFRSKLSVVSMHLVCS